MLASNNFFNSTIFNTEDELQKHQFHNEVGPWFRPKSRKYATLDTQRKQHNKSQIKYNKKRPQASSRYLNTIQSKIATQPVVFQLQKNSQSALDGNQKPHKLKDKNKVQYLLPRIQNINKRSHTKGQILSLYKNNSPLAYELNFITNKKRINKKLSYLPQYPRDGLKSYDSIEKFLNQNQSKYNIYQKCVIQIKRASKNRQLNRL